MNNKKVTNSILSIFGLLGWLEILLGSLAFIEGGKFVNLFVFFNIVYCIMQNIANIICPLGFGFILLVLQSYAKDEKTLNKIKEDGKIIAVIKNLYDQFTQPDPLFIQIFMWGLAFLECLIMLGCAYYGWLGSATWLFVTQIIFFVCFAVNRGFIKPAIIEEIKKSFSNFI